MTNSLRPPLFFLACIWVPLAASAADEKPDFEKIAPGQTFVLAAPVGTTADLLGMGFSEDLSEFDAAGNRHRAFAPKYKKVPENQYFAQFEQLDNEFKLKAHARFLTSSMNVGFSQEKRYMVLRVYQLKEVASLEPTKSLEAVPLVAQKIYYGWALNVVIEGDLTTFTSEAAAELATAGADIESTVKRYNLKKYVHLVGLEAKTKGHISVALDPAKFNDEFQVANTPAPIFIEYKVMKELFSPKLSWQRSGFSPGKYKLTKDVFEEQCTSDKVVTLAEQSSLQINVLDKDLSANDPVGTATLDNIMSAGRPYTPIELTTQDSLQSATVTLVPVSGPSPSVAAPAAP